MTPEQQKIVELEKFKQKVIKQFYEDYDKAVAELVETMGVNAYFQDDDGIVYKTCEPDGTFVKYQRYGVSRTRYDGEAKGSLSMTEAREKGFIVEGK
jgi:hypothetical protein